MYTSYRSLYLATLIFICMLSARPAIAVPITFDWTGQFTVQDDLGRPWINPNNGEVQTPVSGTFTFDSSNPDLSVMSVGVVPFAFLSGGDANTFLSHRSMQQIDGTRLFGRFGIDWCGNPAAFGDDFCFNMDMGIVWDTTGLTNAILMTPGGLQVGDVISGNTVVRGGDIIVPDIGSAIPATDGVETGFNTGVFLNQGPAPMATTTLDAHPLAIVGFERVSFLGDDRIGGMQVIGTPGNMILSVNLDIGSGNSMIVTNVVPVPAAAWLFGSGLLGIIAIARRRNI